MARSEEALKRRAEKRQRSLQEQKQVDFDDVKKRQKLEEEKKKTREHHQQDRSVPRSNDLDSRPSTSKKQRHDPATSKTLVWAQQADPTKVQRNQALRQKYYETDGGKGMDPEELERAKLLIARDERKKQKKERKKQRKAGQVPLVEESKEQELAEGKEDANEESNDKKTFQETPPSMEKSHENCDKIKSATSKKQEHDAKSKETAKSKRDKNKALRAKYQQTAGKGMSHEDIRRAKQLLERDERKKQKRAARQ